MKCVTCQGPKCSAEPRSALGGDGPGGSRGRGPLPGAAQPAPPGAPCPSLPFWVTPRRGPCPPTRRDTRGAPSPTSPCSHPRFPPAVAALGEAHLDTHPRLRRTRLYRAYNRDFTYSTCIYKYIGTLRGGGRASGEPPRALPAGGRRSSAPAERGFNPGAAGAALGGER